MTGTQGPVCKEKGQVQETMPDRGVGLLLPLLCLLLPAGVAGPFCRLASAEVQGPGRIELLHGMQLPMGTSEDLVLTKVGWEDLLDRLPAFAESDLPKLRQELRTNPNARDYRRLVRLLHRLGRHKTAQKTARVALQFGLKRVKENPGSVSDLVELGLAWVSVYRYDKAADALGKAVEIGRRRAEAYAGYALACLSVGQLDVAAKTIQRARKLFPYRPVVLLAAHYVKLSRNTQSPEALRRAVRMKAPDEWIRLLGIEELRQAAESNPDYVAVRRSLGIVLVEVIRERARLHSGILGSLRDLRVLEQDKPILAEAIEHLDYLFEIDHLVSARTLWTRSVGEILRGHEEKAAELAAQAALVHRERPQPLDSIFLSQYLAWLLEQGSYEEVEAFLKGDASRSPSPGDMALRAACSWKLGNHRACRDWAQRLFRALPRALDPHERQLLSAGHTALGAFHLSKGHDEQAEREFREARRWSGENVWLPYALSVTEVLRGRPRQALETLKPILGLLAAQGPDARLFDSLATGSKQQDTATANRRSVLKRQVPALPDSDILDRGLDWMIGFLAFWRSSGPLTSAEIVKNKAAPAFEGVRSVLDHWPNPDFPEPRLELLSAARFVLAVLPPSEQQKALARRFAELDRAEMKKLVSQPESAAAGPAGALGNSFSSDALPGLDQLLKYPPQMTHWVDSLILGCETDLEKVQAIAAWLTLRVSDSNRPTRPVETLFQAVVANPRAQVTADEATAFLIAAGKAVNLRAHYASLPRRVFHDISFPSCALFETGQGQVPVGPGLGVFGRIDERVQPLPDDEAAAIYYGSISSKERLARARAAVKAFPGRARAHLNLSRALLQSNGPAAEALKEAAAATRIEPELAEAHLLQGAALEPLGQRKEATAAFRRARELIPGSAAPSRVRGTLLYRYGNYREAAAELEAALEKQPDDLNTRAYLAACYDRLNRPDAAFNEVTTVLRYADDRQDMRRLLIDLLIRKKRAAALILELEELYAAEPQNEQARSALLDIYREAKKFREAKSLEQPASTKQ